MLRIKRRGIVALTLVGLMAFSGVALADPPAEPEETEEDVFNFGYDELFHLLVWNTSPPECSLENGALGTTYLTVDGMIVVDGLTTGADGEEMDVLFPDPEGGDDIAYADSECGLTAAEVAGPNGQINHGMFMKLFNSLYEGTARGCLNRHLAQSDLGKDDQKVRVSEVEGSDFESVVDGDTGDVEFKTFPVDCNGGKKDDSNGKGHRSEKSNGHGKPESPGKSGEAHKRDR